MTLLYLNMFEVASRSVCKPCPAKLILLNFQPREVVSRYRDPQPQVV